MSLKRNRRAPLGMQKRPRLKKVTACGWTFPVMLRAAGSPCIGQGTTDATATIERAKRLE